MVLCMCYAVVGGVLNINMFAQLHAINFQQNFVILVLDSVSQDLFRNFEKM